MLITLLRNEAGDIEATRKAVANTQNDITFPEATAEPLSRHQAPKKSHSRATPEPLKAIVQPLGGSKKSHPKPVSSPLRKAPKSHREPLEQLRKVTTSHSEPLKSHVRFMFAGDRCPALARSRVTGVRQFHVRDGFCARVYRSVVPFAHASTASKPATHPSRLTKTCYTPFVAHENHGHTHRGTATVPLMLARPSCAVLLVEMMRFHGHFHQQELLQPMSEA